jgi:ABC-type uncharacterized transport system permease subunit
MAKNSLERYTHYYERWATNESVSVRLMKCAVCPCICFTQFASAIQVVGDPEPMPKFLLTFAALESRPTQVPHLVRRGMVVAVK